MSCVGVKVCPSGSVILLRTSRRPFPYVKLVTPIMLGVPGGSVTALGFGQHIPVLVIGIQIRPVCGKVVFSRQLSEVVVGIAVLEHAVLVDVGYIYPALL